MKRLGIVIFLLVSQVLFAGAVKWTDAKHWQKIKNGLTEKTVLNILGEPTYKKVSSGAITYYYSTQEPYIYFVSIMTSSNGLVAFTKKADDRVFTVSRFVEPAYEDVQNYKPKKPVRLKPKRDFEKWETEKNWKKLKVGLAEKQVMAILGEPAERTRWQDIVTLKYGEILGGKLSLKASADNGVPIVELGTWDEPFWYLLNKELFEEVKNEKGKQKN